MTMLKDLITITEDMTPVEGSPEEQLDELTRRMSAARRGLGFANQLKNPQQKKIHMRIIMINLNKIRAHLNRVIRAMEEFENAEADYQVGRGY